MKGADDRILEFIAEEGPSTPTQMHEDGRVRFSRTYINTRCKILEDNGFLVNFGNGVYQITKRGENYLSGEFDAAELENESCEDHEETEASA
jgi:hypothetical protein